MRTIPLCFGLLLFTVPVFAQSADFYLQNGCAYTNSQTEKNLVVYDPSEEAERIVHEIMESLGLSQNFVIKSSGVKNAIATSLNGQRFILYSTTFLEKFKSDANTRWAAYSVLAHEIGHHLNNHNFGETDLKKRKICELEADRFSGSILRMLDATLEEAQAGINTIELENEIATHPSKALRREAVAAGWIKKDEQLQGISGINRFADSDGDQIPDNRDACPDMYSTHTSGCPDADEDGIPNRDDKCPYEKGLSVYKGCPDLGLADRDGDNVPDKTDECPDKKGEGRYAGCPDIDSDGVPDNIDKCMNEKGLAGNKGCPEVAVKSFKNSLPPEQFQNRKSGFEMINVEGGIFTMGSPQNEIFRNSDECQHLVTLNSFRIGKYEVTQADWMDIMGSNPSCDNEKNRLEYPVSQISWDDIQAFLKKLKERFPKRNYRLPTEEEWEYAARGGKNSKDYKYSGSDTLSEVAWHSSLPLSNSIPVGSLKANELGIHDMNGNVWEWCQDKYKPYSGCSGLAGDDRVTRGGGWYGDGRLIRVAIRANIEPSARYCFTGFRLVQDK